MYVGLPAFAEGPYHCLHCTVEATRAGFMLYSMNEPVITMVVTGEPPNEGEEALPLLWVAS